MGNRITINGQHYDDPDAMPPEVRRIYEAAMRTAESSLVSGERGWNTEVFTAQTGDHGSGVVVNRTITVNHRTYRSANEMPPEVRKLYDEALKPADPQAATTHPKTSFHVSVNLGGSQARGLDDSAKARTPVPISIEDSS